MISIYDKLTSRGVQSLSDSEILALILDEVNGASDLPHKLLECFNNSLTAISREGLPRLRMVEGIGLKRAQRLIAAAEWGRRVAQAESTSLTSISNNRDVAAIFRPYFANMGHEECWILYLTNSNNIIERQKVSQGGVASTTVDIRLVVKRALELLSTQIIMVHNHPTGSADPSKEDITLTEKVKSAAELFDIALIDHIVISPTSDYSFRSNKLL